MIQMQTVLPVADNSGAKTVFCIRVNGVGRRRYGLVGDVITCAVRDAIPGAALKHKQVVKAVLVRTKQHIKRKDGSVLSFDENAAVIIDAQNNPRGTRIFGPVARELRDRKFLKITSLSPEVV